MMFLTIKAAMSAAARLLCNERDLTTQVAKSLQHTPK